MAAALGVVVLAVAAAYIWKLAPPEKSTPIPENLPKNLNQQLSGYTFTRSEGGRQIFTVHAARTLAFKDRGKTLLEGVTVDVYGREGTRHDILKTQQCDYEPSAGGLFCQGKVEIELNAKAASAPVSTLKGSQPLYLETSKLNYQPRDSLVVSEAPIRFRYGPTSGTAVGIQYDTQDGWVVLKKDVLLNLPPSGGITSPLSIASASLSYEKVKGQVELRGPLEITQGSRRVLAGQGKIFLDEENRITQAILESGAQGFDTSGDNFLEAKAQTVKTYFDPDSSELRTLVADGDVNAQSRHGGGDGAAASLSRLVAQHVEVSFTDGRSPSAQPVSAVASRNVKLSVESRPTLRSGGASAGARAGGETAPERKELLASQVRFEFDPGGQSLREGKTIGPGELVLFPSDPKEGKRVITAGQFLMAFDGRNHLESVRGLSHTRVVVEPAAQKPSAVPQESWSDELEAKLNATTQDLVTLEQVGNFQFRDGDRQAKADRAFYSAQDQVLTLTGKPLLWDPDTRIRAGQFRLHVRSGMAEGSARVESTHFGPTNADISGLPRPGVHDTPGTSSAGAGATTNVLADRMRAQRDSQFVHYEGHVRAWNGYDVVESPSLDIYRKQGRIVSGSGVVTSHLQPGPTRSGSLTSASGVPVTVRADRLEYLSEQHKASYRGRVEVNTADTTLKADQADVYFSAPPAGPGKPTGAAQIERAVAAGHVTVTQPNRRATGDHVEYFPGPGKVILTGGPPTLYDAQNGFTTGQSLTFFVHDDSLLVDGGEKSSTLSRRHLAR